MRKANIVTSITVNDQINAHFQINAKIKIYCFISLLCWEKKEQYNAVVLTWNVLKLHFYNYFSFIFFSCKILLQMN